MLQCFNICLHVNLTHMALFFLSLCNLLPGIIFMNQVEKRLTQATQLKLLIWDNKVINIMVLL